jgi:hypothetical protein
LISCERAPGGSSPLARQPARDRRISAASELDRKGCGRKIAVILKEAPRKTICRRQAVAPTEESLSETGGLSRRNRRSRNEDAGGDGQPDPALISQDFNVRSFRSNAVLRWEWRPGSTMYLVWQRDRYSEEVFGRDVGVGALTDTFGGRGDNFLALKMTYWIPVL